MDIVQLVILIAILTGVGYIFFIFVKKKEFDEREIVSLVLSSESLVSGALTILYAYDSNNTFIPLSPESIRITIVLGGLVLLCAGIYTLQSIFKNKELKEKQT